MASPEPFFDIERVVPVYANSGFHFATSWIRECMDGGNVRTNSNTTHHPTVDVSESIRGTELFPHIAVDARVSRRVRIISARLKVQIGLVAVDVDHVSISIHHSPEGLEKKRKEKTLRVVRVVQEQIPSATGEARFLTKLAALLQ